MNKKGGLKIILCLIAVLFLVWNPAFAQRTLSAKLAEGNKLYADGQYDKALTKYNDAQIEAPASPEIFFNMGNVFFRQGKYKEAIDSYRKSMEKGTVDIEAKAMYNIGNALFRQGRLREALQYYKQALERDPDDIDTKYNIEYTERMIKQMLSKAQETMKKAQEEQKKRQERQKQQGFEADAERQQQKSQEAEVQAQQKQRQQDEQAQEQAQQKQAQQQVAALGQQPPKEGDEGRKEAVRPGDKEPGELSKDEAERFLSVFERDRKDSPLLSQRQSRRGQGYYVEKDW